MGQLHGHTWARRARQFRAVPGSAVAAPVAGDPIAAVIRGAGPIAGSAYYPDGWVIDVTFLGVLAGTPDATKITVSTLAPGYVGGVLTTVARTVRGTIGLRKIAPNQTTFNVVAAANTTVSYALDAPIHAGETIVSVAISAGAYGGGSNAAVLSGGSVTNSSTWAYEKGVGKFVTPQDLEATGATFRIEWAGMHWAARNGREFESVTFTWTDESGNSGTATVSDTSVSTRITGANASGVYAEVWGYDVPLAGLNQGERISVRAVAKPWVGDATAVLDSDPAADGFAWPGAGCTTLCNLWFLNNRTGGYGTAYAYVDSANGTAGGVVSQVPGTASATPFQTILQAATAIQTFNNANFGRNNAGNGRIRLKDNAAHTQFGASGLNTLTAGKTYLFIEDDPANAGFAIFTSASGSGATTAAKRIMDLTCFRGRIRIQPFSAAVGENTLLYSGVTSGSSLRLLIGFGVDIPMQAQNTNPWRGCRWVTLFNVTCSNVGASFFVSASTNGENYVLLGGVVQTGSGSKLYARNAIACIFNGCNLTEPAALTNIEALDGGLLHDCKLLKCTSANALGASLAYSRGFAMSGNVIENIDPAGSVPCFQFGADGMPFAMKNVHIWNNTFVGQRTNWWYTDDDYTAGFNPQKTGTKGQNIVDQSNLKTDTFVRASPAATVATAANRTGGWRVRHGVACGPECYIGSAYDGTVAASGDAGCGDFLVASTVFAQASNAEANLAAKRATMFAGSLAGPSLGGGGNYALAGAVNPAYGLVAAAARRRKFDITSALRRTDGTGALGAHERTL